MTNINGCSGFKCSYIGMDDLRDKEPNIYA